MSTATLKFIRLSPTKARLLTREVQGMNAELALASLEFAPNKAAGIIAKVIASAVANGGFEPEEVEIVSCRVDKGPVLKRFRPRARGSASRILKPTSHIFVEVAPAGKKDDSKKGAKNASKETAKKTPAKKSTKSDSKADSKKAPAKTAETKTADKKETTKTAPAKKADSKVADTKAKAPVKKAETKVSSSKTDLTDLTLLSGVGPAVARSLNAEGITSVEQVAKLTKAELEELDANIGIKGDVKDKWQAEAKEILKNYKKES
jgi:large subunit ribosomal protein L22